MLLRRTLTYLPAQIIGPLAQFLAAIAWTYYLEPDAFGTYALIWAIQELALLVVLSWWSTYALRYITSHSEDRQRFDGLEIAIQLVGALLQTVIVGIALAVVFHSAPSLKTLVATLCFTLTRNVSAHFGDRARASTAILAYTILNSCGPALGLALGIGAVMLWGPAPEIVLWSYTAAQLLGLVLAWPMIRTGTLKPRLEPDLLRRALSYGVPFMIGNALAWGSTHGIRFIVEQEQGLTGVGLVSVGWWLGLRATTFVALLVNVAGFTLAVEKIRQGGSRAALPQIASNGALLLGVLLPTLAGAIMLNGPFVDALVAEPYRAITRDILPLAMATGVVRIYRMHGTDQCLLLFNRPKLDIALAGAETLLTLLGCYLGLRFDGARGAVAGCLAANVVVTTTSFLVAHRLFGYYLRLGDLARIAIGVGVMIVGLDLLPTPHSRIELAAVVAAGAALFLASIAATYPRQLAVALEHSLEKCVAVFRLEMRENKD